MHERVCLRMPCITNLANMNVFLHIFLPKQLRIIEIILFNFGTLALRR